MRVPPTHIGRAKPKSSNAASLAIHGIRMLEPAKVIVSLADARHRGDCGSSAGTQAASFAKASIPTVLKA